MYLPSLGWPVRWELAFLISLGLAFNYSLRLNLSIAITTMGNSTHSPMWPMEGRERLVWSVEDRSLVLSAFYYGYCSLQIPGGRLAEQYGTKWVFGLGMLGVSILGFLTPLAAYTNVWALFVLRVAQGMCESVAFPSMNPMIARWAPLEERSKFTSVTWTGSTVGTVLTFPLCGFLLEQYPWEVVFYSTSALSLLWCCLWFLLVCDLPEVNTRVSESERNLILATRTFDPVIAEKQINSRIIPLLWDMVRNRAVMLNALWHFCQAWGNMMMMTMTPTFLEKVLGFDIKNNGVMSMLPHLSRAVIGPVCSTVYDLCLQWGLPQLSLQRCATLVTGLMGAAGLVMVSQLSTWDLRYYCVAAMAVGYGFTACGYSGYVANMQSIAPNNSGTVYGLCNTISNTSGILMPLVISLFTSCEGCETNPTNWSYPFWMCSGFYLGGAIVWSVFARVEVQSFSTKDYSRRNKIGKTSTFKPSYKKRENSISEFM